jgi:hypothetical protein
MNEKQDIEKHAKTKFLQRKKTTNHENDKVDNL